MTWKTMIIIQKKLNPLDKWTRGVENSNLQHNVSQSCRLSTIWQIYSLYLASGDVNWEVEDTLDAAPVDIKPEEREEPEEQYNDSEMLEHTHGHGHSHGGEDNTKQEETGDGTSEGSTNR